MYSSVASVLITCIKTFCRVAYLLRKPTQIMEPFRSKSNFKAEYFREFPGPAACLDSAIIFHTNGKKRYLRSHIVLTFH